MLRTRPLFTLDPGWLFLAAGLAMFVAVTLIPAHRDAHQLREQLSRIRSEEQYAYERLRAYTAFLDEMEDPDPAMLRRLAATQLNMIPRGEQPVIVSTSQVETVTGWVDSSVRFEPHEPTPLPDTMLANLAAGRPRIWLVGGAVLAMFMGLLLTPGLTRARPARRAPDWQRKTARSSLVAATVAENDADDAEPAVQITCTKAGQSHHDTLDGDPDADDCDEPRESRDAASCDDDDPLNATPGKQGHFRWMNAAAIASIHGPKAHDSDLDEPETAPADSLIRQIEEPRLPFPREKPKGEVETKPDAAGSAAGFDQLKAMIRAEVATETIGSTTDEPDVETVADATAGDIEDVNLLGDAGETDDWHWQESPPEQDADNAVQECAIDDHACPDHEPETKDTAETEVDDADFEDASEDLVDDEMTDAVVAADADKEAELEDDCEDDEQFEDDEEYESEVEDEDGEYVYEYYDEDGNLIDPEDLDDDEWEFVDSDEDEVDEEEDDAT